MARYDPKASHSGLKRKPCTNCGRPGHEHNRIVVEHTNGRKRYGYECPDDGFSLPEQIKSYLDIDKETFLDR